VSCLLTLILAILVVLTGGVPPALALDESAVPSKFSLYWGASAGSSYIRNIPTSSQIGIQNCAASLTDGFPPLTFQATSAGGCFPYGQDMNGILRQLSQWSQWQAAGNPILYDSGFSSSIGGYPKWATLSSANVPGCFWISTVDNNASDPDTGGANWINSCAVGGVLTGTLPNVGLAAGAAATNVGTLGGSLAGTLPNPSVAPSGIVAGTYPHAISVTYGADGRATAVVAYQAPTFTVVTTQGPGTFTTPTGATALRIRMVGGGGSGAGSGSGASPGTAGNLSSFGSTTAFGGGAGSVASGAQGGIHGAGGTGGSTGTGVEINRVAGTAGGDGSPGAVTGGTSSAGGGSPFWGGGGAASWTGGDTPATLATGGGGAGSGATISAASNGGGGGSGGGGEGVEFMITSPAASYSYVVGLAVLGGNNGTGGYPGGNSAGGRIVIEVDY
jgi:hypothetical protein